jgi:predicted Zn-dependent peptidase
VRPLDERIRAIRAVTAADVQRVVRTYLRPESRTVVHVVAPPVVAEAKAPAEGAGAADATKGGVR